eukprot:1979480-Pleurochrysis_carterae.AAC.1
MLRQQVGGRAGEAEPAREKHRGAELLPARGKLAHLVLHVLREDNLLQVPVDRGGQSVQQVVELVHLLIVGLLQQPERQDHPVVFIVCAAACFRRSLSRNGGSGDGTGIRGSGARALNHATRLLHPALVELARLAQRERAHLLLEVCAEERHHVLLKVGPAQAF